VQRKQGNNAEALQHLLHAVRGQLAYYPYVPFLLFFFFVYVSVVCVQRTHFDRSIHPSTGRTCAEVLRPFSIFAYLCLITGQAASFLIIANRPDEAIPLYVRGYNAVCAAGGPAMPPIMVVLYNLHYAYATRYARGGRGITTI
jgi:hypothetical protein